MEIRRRWANEIQDIRHFTSGKTSVHLGTTRVLQIVHVDRWVDEFDDAVPLAQQRTARLKKRGRDRDGGDKEMNSWQTVW